MQSNQSQENSANGNGGFDKLGLGIFLYAYAILLGACYLFAYWRPIGFNVFPYLSLQDYISAPLNRLSVLVAMPLIFAAIIFGGKKVGEGERRNIAGYLAFLYSLAFFIEFYHAMMRYLSVNFHFANENSVLSITVLIFVAGAGFSIYAHRKLAVLPVQIAGLVLMQCSVSLAAGYSDGKAIYNGAMQVHFLDNKDLCESGGIGDWAFLGVFGSQAFFINTIDKRLCLTEQKNMRLVSRQVKEALISARPLLNRLTPSYEPSS